MGCWVASSYEVILEPYDPADTVYTGPMTFEREDGKKDRLYGYGARQDASRPVKQEYFYRAMKKAEAAGWLGAGHDATIDANGHQGWASYRQYSLKYLTRRHQYTHLLEVHAPDFISWMKEIGVTSGKAEGGDISWGVGLTNSNAFKPSKRSNPVLAALYTEVFHQPPIADRRGMAKQLAPVMFKRSIKWVKLVNFRSQKP